MNRVALLGWPVAESLSPRMQNAAFAAAGLAWEYAAVEVEPEGLAAAVHRALARRPEDRFPDVAAFSQALRQFG